MADAFFPILRPGVAVPPPTHHEDVYTYATRDFRGVEAPAAAPADRSGFNEEAEFTARADAARDSEHDEKWIHRTAKIAMVVLLLRNTIGTAYAIEDESEERGNTGAGIVATFTRISAGVFDITLTSALLDADLALVNLTEDLPDLDHANLGDFCRCYCQQINSSSKWRVERWQGQMGSMVKADGDFRFAIHQDS